MGRTTKLLSTEAAEPPGSRLPTKAGVGQGWGPRPTAVQASRGPLLTSWSLGPKRLLLTFGLTAVPTRALSGTRAAEEEPSLAPLASAILGVQGFPEPAPPY